MIWEALIAIGTIFTGLVIFVTVVLGARQLRTTNEQLQQLKLATQLEGTMKIFDVLREPLFSEAQRFVFSGEFQERLKDEQFRRDAERPSGVDAEVHKERHLLRTFEEIGTYIKHGLLNGDQIYDLTSPVIIGAWQRLKETVDAQRLAYGGDDLWENFEHLYAQAKLYDDSHHPGG